MPRARSRICLRISRINESLFLQPITGEHHSTEPIYGSCWTQQWALVTKTQPVKVKLHEFDWSRAHIQLSLCPEPTVYGWCCSTSSWGVFCYLDKQPNQIHLPRLLCDVCFKLPWIWKHSLISLCITTLSAALTLRCASTGSQQPSKDCWEAAPHPSSQKTLLEYFCLTCCSCNKNKFKNHVALLKEKHQNKTNPFESLEGLKSSE